MKKIGVGVVGVNPAGVGYMHVLAYSGNSRCRVRGICDLNTDQIGKIAREYRIETVTSDFKDLLRNKEIDLISIATPDSLHAEQSIAAMMAGKHVLCEKPMALSIEECERIIKTADKTGVKFMVGQISRFTPAFKETKKMIDKGQIGELFYVESEYAHNYLKLAGVGEWRKDPRRVPFLGGGCHPVDLLRWIAGDAEEVFAYANHKNLLDWPVDDCMIAIFRFKGNILGKVFVSIGCQRPYTMRSVFYGTEGTIISDNTSPFIKVFLREMVRKKRKNKREADFINIPVCLASHNVADEIDEILDCIIYDKPVMMDAREGARTVSTCLSAVESAKKGKPVKVRNQF